ncbi:hypothetical protein GCM10016234_05860 [Tianweitania populi]|uniref:Uncharacterized protein n=1 Tax=Tianweitania populi TaxID=1607949 RepID=A0A8J3DNK8_9HYPH|nr:hypothetical protein GCM10016234_05860 [Tianweitania populi]
MLPLRIWLPGGTLKVKRYWHLRSDERARLVPVWKVGATYFVWRSRHESR